MTQSSTHFTTIVITSPEFLPEEASYILRLLESEAADFVDIRKPRAPDDAIATLINDIPEVFHHRLRLHDAFSIGHQLGISAYQLNRRHTTAPQNATSVTRSCHSLNEYSDKYDYITLSPIFQSISKKDYTSPFNLEKLAIELPGKRVIALGGITPAHFSRIADAGFIGAAMLGYVWSDISDQCLEQRIQEITSAKNRINNKTT